MEILKTPQQVKNGLRYVLLNPAKHFKKSPYVDNFSSGALFEKWRQLIGKALPIEERQRELKSRLETFLSPPSLWLSQVGWMRALY